MADFNAGSIVGTLELDRNPFIEGLAAARREADAFEANPITAKLNLDAGEAEGQLAAFEAETATAPNPTLKVNLDDTEATGQLALFETEADVATRDRTINIKTNKSQLSEATREIGLLPRLLSNVGLAANNAFGQMQSSITSAIGSAGESGGGGGAGMIGLAVAASGLAAALVPIGAAALDGIGVIGSMAASAGVSLGAFALVAKSDFGAMTAALKAVQTAQAAAMNAKTPQEYAAAIKALKVAQEQLKGPAGVAATAYQHLQAAFAKLKKETAGPVFHTLAVTFRELAKFIAPLRPLIDATAKGLDFFVKTVGDGLLGPFTTFVRQLSREVGPALTQLAPIVVNFVKGFLHIIEQFNGQSGSFLTWLDHISLAFLNWTKRGGGVTKFIAYVKSTLPAVIGFFKAFGGLLIQIIGGLGKKSTGPSIVEQLGTFLKNYGPVIIVVLEGLATSFELLLTVLNLLAPAVNFMLGLYKDLGTAIGVAAYKIYTAWGPMKRFFAGIWGALKSGVNHATSFFGDVGHFIGKIPHAIQVAWSGVAGFFSGVWGAISHAFSTAWGFISGVATKIGGVFSTIKSWISSGLTGALNTFTSLWSGAWGAVSGAVETMWSIVQPILDELKKLLGDLLGPIGKVIGGLGKVLHTGGSLLHKVVPGFAGGTPGPLAAATLAMVGERGPELAMIPAGSQIINNSDTQQIIDGAGRGSLASGSASLGGSSIASYSGWSRLVDAINALRSDMLNQLPNATGEAVGAYVGPQLSRSVLGATQAATTAARAG